MIKHIVFWKLKDSHEGKTKPEIADDLRIRITKLCESISTMKKFDVAVIGDENEMAVDLVLYSEFDSWEGLRTYAEHPDHVAFKSYIQERRTERRVADYEV